MDQSIYVQLAFADPVTALKSALRFLHFIGLALGLGAATLLDLMLLRFFLTRSITRELMSVFRFATRVVNIGLIILWITGIAFMVHYAIFDPIKLTNGKIWAKLSIVAVLTLNGVFIHAFLLPRLDARIGRPLFAGMSRGERLTMQFSGAVSVTSWYVPAMLGAFPQLNFAVPATTILITYMLLLAAAVIAMHAAIAIAQASQRPRAIRRSYPPGLHFT